MVVAELQKSFSERRSGGESTVEDFIKYTDEDWVIHTDNNRTENDIKDCEVIWCQLTAIGRAYNLAKKYKKKLVYYAHNDYRCSIVGRHPNIGVIYNSEWVKKSLGYSNPSVVIQPIINPKDYKVKRGELVTLINLNKNKGGKLFAQLGRDDQLGVVGGYGQQIEQPQNVRVLPQCDIREVYRQTRILLMPSKYESWGRTASEAGASGIPVICSRAPGLVEQMGDAVPYLDELTVKNINMLIKKVDNSYKEWSERVIFRVEQLWRNNGYGKFRRFIGGLKAIS